MKSIQNFTPLKLSNEKMEKLTGGSVGPITGSSTGTTSIFLPQMISLVDSENLFKLGQTASNSLNSAAVLVGSDINFGSTQIGNAHESQHISQNNGVQ